MFLPTPDDGRVYVTAAILNRAWRLWTDLPIEHLAVERVLRVRMRDVLQDPDVERDLGNAMILRLPLALHWRRFDRHFVFLHATVLSVDNEAIVFSTQGDVTELTDPSTQDT